MNEDLVRLAHNLRNAEYKFAKTYAKTLPHFYTLKKTWDDPDEFVWTGRAVNKYGELRNMVGTPRKYYKLDGWIYWLMWSPERENLINRARD